jgi:hypothetical protein
MAQELANLPRFTAFAKVIEEKNGYQSVLKRRITTFPLPPQCKLPIEDEDEIRQRQEKWRKGGSEEPPPTHY